MVSFLSVKPIVWMSEPTALLERLPLDTIRVTTLDAYLRANAEGRRVSFVDGEGLAALESAAIERQAAVADLLQDAPVIAVCDGPLPTGVGLLHQHSWLSHLVGTQLLRHTFARGHLKNVVQTLEHDGHTSLLDWVRDTLTGRRVQLHHASSRAERIEKMAAYFEQNGVGARTTQHLRDAAEELLTNAFYDAPVEAGAVSEPIARQLDVSLPENNACDLVYGCSEDFAILRVRDPFGALSRDRVVQVLNRCARGDMQVEVDSTRGGAGLGMWRIVSVASFVAVSVVSYHHTDFLVGIAKRPLSGAKPYALHLFVRGGAKTRHWKLADEGDGTAASLVTFL
jgi:hypothetical protein